jgi:glycosyltransferase involved in cell wall biosynthesis
MSSPLPDTIAFLGGFLPRLCGIATFTHDLCEAIATEAPSSQCFVCAVNDTAEAYEYPLRVRFEIDEKNLDSYRRAADFLNFNNAGVLCLQHEFGIFGGAAGGHVVALLKEVRMPVVTTLHTLLREPDVDQRRVMDGLVRQSERLVVMADKGAEILQTVYGVPNNKIDVIPHGIPDMPSIDSGVYKTQFGVEGRTVLLTFGLLGPGKGIEYVIKALPEIIQRHPEVVYLVLGATHPHLVAREGESYRQSLERLTEDLGVKDHVIFYNRFVSLDDLKEFIGATDIYITPYLNEAQITSGTLAYVFGAGKAVVSTPYWHAQELLAGDRGTLVPFRDAPAIAEAVCAYLTDAERFHRTRETAYAMGRGMIWPAAARRYLDSFQRAREHQRIVPRTAFAGWTVAARPFELPRFNIEHVVRMSDDTGILQHATFNVPNFGEGYCTDDNARAFILCTLMGELNGTVPSADIDRLAKSYLAFLAAAFNEQSNRFRNFMSFDRKWLEEAGSEDSHARAIWAVGCGAGRSRNPGHRKLSARLLQQSASVVTTFSSPRAWAFALLGIHEFLKSTPGITEMEVVRRTLTDHLLRLWNGFATDDWPWFEPIAAYDNARLCQALIESGQYLHDPEALRIGIKSLSWLVSLQKTQPGHFRPIGSNGFYAKGGARADFDQQPVEAQAMIAACLAASRATGVRAWADEAKRTFEWFLGRNDLGQPLYDPGSGGCGDGLHSDRVNENQGAESTLAFLLSLAEMRLAENTTVSAGRIS